ncbi:TadE family type IV pilus minor pilin [Nocardia sp. NPDC004340]
MATVEAAIALAALVAVVILGVGALLAVSAQVRCVDAAREAARLAARGETDAGVATARRLAPSDARIVVRSEGELVVAEVSAHAALVPVTLHAAAVAAREPGESP